MKRIFIAINLPEHIKEQFTQFQKNWPTLPCRWLKKETFHITLAFLGNRNEQELEKIYEAVKETAEKNAPFSIFLNKVCYGPPRMKPPRLVWVESEKSAKFLQLKIDLNRTLGAEKINFKPDERDSAPHITIARIKKWNWQRLEPEQRPEVDLAISLEIPVNSIEVMEAHLKRTGAEYEVLWKSLLDSLK